VDAVEGPLQTTMTAARVAPCRVRMNITADYR
jgi:hypothetical protein